jgi:hypothetical protein
MHRSSRRSETWNFGIAWLGHEHVAWIALIAGVLIVLMVVDLFDRKRYPNRQGVGLLGGTVIISVFFAATVGTAALYWVLCAR